MLRTNSKKVLERIRIYIIKHFDASNYSPEFDDIDGDDFGAVCNCIITIARREKFYLRNKNIYMLLEDWFRGLPSALNTYPLMGGEETKDILGEWLEETEAEKARYSDEKATETAIYLISREIVKGAAKA